MLNVILAVLLASAGSATAAGPTETVQTAVQRVFSQTGGPVKTVSIAERRADIRKVAEGLFDFHEMSRRSLGGSWTQASPAEQEEFVQLFTSLIASAYMGKIEQYTGEPIAYLGERVDGADASVQSRVVTPKGSQVAIEYRLYRTPDRWAVYDINVDGVSLVASYRSQFSRVIQRGSFADLLKQLRLKAGT